MKRFPLSLGAFALALSASSISPGAVAAESPFPPAQEVKTFECETLNMPSFPTMSLGECMAISRTTTLQNSGAGVIASCKGNEEFNPDLFYLIYDSLADCIQQQLKGPPPPPLP
jgi:hypothetical protein